MNNVEIIVEHECVYLLLIAKKLPKTDPTQQRGGGGAPGRPGRVVDIEKDRTSDGGGGCCSKN